jgi:hypothetical protein
MEKLESRALFAAGALDPSFGGGGATTYQAEDAFLDGPVVKRDHPGYTGAGFADYVNNSGDTIEFQPRVDSSGTYTLEFRYANGSTVNRGLDLIVNGIQISPRVSFPPTGSWSTWRTATATVPLLGGGVNTPSSSARPARAGPTSTR